MGLAPGVETSCQRSHGDSLGAVQHTELEPVHSALRAAMGLPEAHGEESTYQASGTTIEVVGDGRSAVTVATADLPALVAQLADGAIPFARRSDGSLRVPLPGRSQADLVFVPA